MKRKILLPIFFTGFTAMTAQILIIREFMIVFCGNELSAGIILGSWLFWGAAGSWFLGGVADKVKSKTDVFSGCLVALGLILPLSVLEVRFIKFLFNFTPGEIVGFMPMVLASAVVLAPLCMLLGFMFSLACRICEIRTTEGVGKVSMVYVWESAGAMLGGGLTSFVLIRFINAITIVLVLGLINILAAVCFQSGFQKNKAGIFLLVFIGGIALGVFKGGDILERYSRNMQWQGYEIVASKNSIYGSITLIKGDAQYSFFDNGVHLYTVPDELASEEVAHLPLLEHKDPKEVLLVGGGVSGVIREILKQPVRRIDYIELDPVIVEMAKKYLPGEERRPLMNDKVAILNLDGRFYIKRTHHKYDCVIVNVGDPNTAYSNRYYSVDFFNEVRKVLKKGGIVSFGLSSSGDYADREQGGYLMSAYVGLKETFKNVLAIPGNTTYLFASDQEGALAYDYKILMKRIKERSLELKYIGERYLSFKLSSQAINYLPVVLRQRAEIKASRDFQPASYCYNMIHQTARFGDTFLKKMLRAANFEVVRNFTLIMCSLILLASVVCVYKKKDFYKGASLLSLTVTGFSTMGIQILLIHSFQIIYGYIFYDIGLLLTVFMAGLVTGNLFIIRRMPSIKNGLTLFIFSEIIICVLAFSLPEVCSRLLATDSRVFSQLGANAIFPFALFILGMIAGVQFFLTNKIFLGNSKEVGKIAGLVYGMDLIGACFGSFLTGIFLIPALGVKGSFFIIGIVNVSVLAVLFLSHLRREHVSYAAIRDEIA